MPPDPLSTTFAALADPTRRAILARLAEGDATVGELAAPFDLALATVSRHLQVLERAELITREKDAQWRRCRLQAAGLQDVAAWIQRYSVFWKQQLDLLATYFDGPEQGQPSQPTTRRKRRRI